MKMSSLSGSRPIPPCAAGQPGAANPRRYRRPYHSRHSAQRGTVAQVFQLGRIVRRACHSRTICDETCRCRARSSHRLVDHDRRASNRSASSFVSTRQADTRHRVDDAARNVRIRASVARSDRRVRDSRTGSTSHSSVIAHCTVQLNRFANVMRCSASPLRSRARLARRDSLVVLDGAIIERERYIHATTASARRSAIYASTSRCCSDWKLPMACPNWRRAPT